MNQKNNTVKRKKWQHISERERIEIELLYKEGYKAKDIARALGRDRRTIERELKKGMKSKKILNPYVSRNPNVPDYLVKTFYEAKKAQDYANKQKMFKGRPVKIAQDKELMDYIETLIADENFSPDAVIGQIKAKGLKFSTMICTKTVYNMIDRGDFYRITNKNLPVKRNKKPRKYQKIHKVARNNKKGRSIELRPAEIDER
ncbi:MAG: helix-turn-helix domain-containing protein, partial [Treponemataceae bacterium]